MHYFKATGWLTIFNSPETVTGRTVDVDAWDAATGVPPLAVDPSAVPVALVTLCIEPGHVLCKLNSRERGQQLSRA